MRVQTSYGVIVLPDDRYILHLLTEFLYSPLQSNNISEAAQFFAIAVSAAHCPSAILDVVARELGRESPD